MKVYDDYDIKGDKSLDIVVGGGGTMTYPRIGRNRSGPRVRRHMRLVPLLVISVCAQALIAQDVTFASGAWSGVGITIVPYDPSQSFALLARPASAPGLIQSGIDVGGVMPYSFVLRNGSTHTIVAYSARWSTTDALGKIRTRDRVWANLLTMTGGDAIAPLSDRLVMPLAQLAPSSSPTGAANFAAAIDNARKTLGNQADVAVSLEAIVFDNGLALGSDSGNVIAQMSSRINADREVLLGVIAASRQGRAAVTVYLQSLAAGQVAGGLIAASQEKTPELAYAHFFSVQRAEFARGYLALAAQNVAALVSLAEARTKKAPFVIHR